MNRPLIEFSVFLHSTSDIARTPESMKACYREFFVTAEKKIEKASQTYNSPNELILGESLKNVATLFQEYADRYIERLISVVDSDPTVIADPYKLANAMAWAMGKQD